MAAKGWRARLGAWIEAAEQVAIAVLLAAMVLVTFVQVVLRYVFNSGFLWAVEFTTFAFAWLVLFGVSYGVKHAVHLGVDAFVRLFPTAVQRAFGLLAVLAGLAYAGIMFAGAWDYVGKLYRIGIHATDLPVPRWIPYGILVVGTALLFLRLVQAGVRIVRGERTGLLADEARGTIREILGEEAGER